MEMENAEEVLQSLDEFAKLKPKHIPRELEDYLSYVAKTGDPVYQWSIVKCLFREKLLNVITEFYETTPTIDLPPCPNVDPFNYETMKNSLLERLDSFPSAPFTVQRLCELLTTPRKEYSRADKFMRAIEKNILVVSTREPGNVRRTDNNGQPELLMNGVMDGRSIELGEAIETVSSDGVNLMHADENEVNVTENENMPVECSGMEDVDMEDQSENSNACNSSTWEKEHDVSQQNEDGDKSCTSSEEVQAEVGNKGDSCEGNISDKDSESNAPEKDAAEIPADSSVTTADVKTVDLSKESCTESATEVTEAKDVEAVDVNSSDQVVESQDSLSEENSEKTEKESDVVTEEPVEETASKKAVSQQETPVEEVDSKNSEEVPSTDSSCSSVENESKASTTTEAANKASDSCSETSATVDTKDEATAEINATSPSANASTQEKEEDKSNVPVETETTENETEETQVTVTKDDNDDDNNNDDASCSTPQKQETELSKHVVSKGEENEITEDLEAKEGIAPTDEPQTESTGQEEAMEVETTPPAAEEMQHCDEPMDQTEQPHEESEEEGKS